LIRAELKSGNQLLQEFLHPSINLCKKPTFVQTTSRWSPWLDGAECAEESTDASDLQKQPNQWLCQNCATSCLGTRRRRRRRRRRITTIQCVQSLGICNLQGISRMEMQRCREKYQMMAQEEHVVAVELEESEASDQTCFVAVAVASLLSHNNDTSKSDHNSIIAKQ
jgi:hypothetical protein